jgi:lactoylglutathione lyase
MKIDNVRLLTVNFDACFRFYRDVMGFTPTWGKEGDSFASFQAGDGPSVDLFDRAAMAEVVGTGNLPNEAAAQDRVALVCEVDDLDAEVMRLMGLSVTIVAGPQKQPDWDISTLHVRDPDGNLIEFYVPLVKSEWSDDLQTEARSYEQP